MDKTKKKLVFWGIGVIGQRWLGNINASEYPVFLIDKNEDVTEYAGRKVYRPDEIINWKELFIVITTSKYSEIQNYLEDKGLVYGQDFVDYRTHFNLPELKTLDEYICDINKDILKETVPTMLVFAPLTGKRDGAIVNFFKKKRWKEKQIYISSTERTLIDLSKKMDATVYPNVLSMERERLCEDSLKKYWELLEKTEQEFVASLCQECFACDELRIVLSAEYYYLKKLVDRTNACKIIVWGGWSIKYYLLKEIANKNEIEFRFAEFGEIPGTIQLDELGTEGGCACAKFPEKLMSIEVLPQELENVRKIEEHIRETQLDSISFDYSEENQNKRKHLKEIEERKILFVGTDDNGIEFVSGSKRWNDNVSTIVNHSYEIAQDVYDICKKNGWKFIYKPHPNTPFDMKEKDAIFFDSISVDELITVVDVVVSVKSKTDYKALMYGKPLVLLGLSAMHRKGCAYEVFEKEQLEEMISKAIDNGYTTEQKHNFERHVAQLLKTRLWNDEYSNVNYGLMDKVWR